MINLIAVFVLGVPTVLYFCDNRFPQHGSLMAGLAGSWAMLIVFFVASLICSNDYTERGRTSSMWSALSDVQAAWKKGFANGKRLTQADINLSADAVIPKAPGAPSDDFLLYYLRVFQNGTIVLIGGQKVDIERMLVFTAEVSGGEVKWQCLGGGLAYYHAVSCRP